MRIFLLDDMAFVDLNAGYLLCIGTKAEVDKADAVRIADMVKEAIAASQFRSIETSKGKRVN